jgi:hypothetical protein
MHMKSLLTVAVSLFCLISASAASAADKVDEKRVAADTPEKFAETIKLIHEDMDTGGRYEYIKPQDKARVDTDLNAMAAMLQKSGSVAAMGQDDRVKLFNIQEHLNGVLSHSDSNRLVCEHRPPVGTNIPTTTCKTFAQIEKERTDSQKYMQDEDRNGWKGRTTSH